MCVYRQLESTREDHHLLLFRLRDMSKQTEHFIAPRETASTKNNGAQRRQPLIQVVNSSDEVKPKLLVDQNVVNVNEDMMNVHHPFRSASVPRLCQRRQSHLRLAAIIVHCQLVCNSLRIINLLPSATLLLSNNNLSQSNY